MTMEERTSAMPLLDERRRDIVTESEQK